MENDLVRIENLSFSFRTYGGTVQAVRDVSFSVKRGETVGIVGESGCGKTALAQCIARLNPEPPGFFAGGRILFSGKDVLQMNRRELRAFRSEKIGFVFQDPESSLNPGMRIGAQMEEALIHRKGIGKEQRRRECMEMLELAGIRDVPLRYTQYPHELSGGMKQRVMIAMALVKHPDLLICDEPTTALDVTVEAQILELIAQLRDTTGTGILMISHNLGVIAGLCDRVLVMYGGKIVEQGGVRDIFYKTAHPYTKALMGSVLKADARKNAELTYIEGTPPDLFAPPKGCPFAARCGRAMEICCRIMPEQTALEDGHTVSCWLQHEKAKRYE